MSKTAYISLKNPGYNYGYKGFCSIVTNIIDIAVEHHAEYKNFNCIVDDNQTLALFEQINLQPKNTISYDAGTIYLQRLLSNTLFSGKKYNAHTVANLDNLKLRNFVYKNTLKIKQEYEEKFFNKFNQFNITEKTLGVHIRGTDKKTELPEINPDQIVLKLKNFISQNDTDKIFLSTDDVKYVDLLKHNFGNFLIYDNSNIISTNSSPIHFTQNRERINEEALSSAYLLSKCKNFFYCFSNVSFLALILGAENFYNIINLN